MSSRNRRRHYTGASQWAQSATFPGIWGSREVLCTITLTKRSLRYHISGCCGYIWCKITFPLLDISSKNWKQDSTKHAHNTHSVACIFNVSIKTLTIYILYFGYIHLLIHLLPDLPPTPYPPIFLFSFPIASPLVMSVYALRCTLELVKPGVEVIPAAINDQ